MKGTIAALALALAAVAPAAVAATRIDTAGFTISYVDGPSPERWNIGLAAAGPSGATISLDTLNDDLGPYYPAYDLFANGTSNGNVHSSGFFIEAHDGYRITNLTLAGIAHGTLAPGQLGAIEGVARNDVSIGWVVQAGGDYHPGPLVRYLDFDGNEAFASTTGTLPFGNAFYLVLFGAVDAYAEAATDGMDYRTSYALAGLSNVALTVEVAPVPEPAPIAMLAAGLAIAGWTARRRRA